MSLCREQLSQNSRWPGSHRYRYRAGSRRWQKNQLNRWLRRKARRLLDETPVKPAYENWP